MSTSEETRRVIIERAAADAGRSWASSVFASLAQEGRRVEGGRPGTIREARARGGEAAGRALREREMTAPTHEELEHLGRTTRDEARRRWRKVSE